MGLRFRKSVSLCKGVRLNFGKTGVSLSSGIPGFRKTIHSSGRVTTSIGIPGTGIYYVDTKDLSKKKEEKKSKELFSDMFKEDSDNVTMTSNNISANDSWSYDRTEYSTTSFVQPIYEATTTKPNFSTASMPIEMQETKVNVKAVTDAVEQNSGISVSITEQLEKTSKVEAIPLIERVEEKKNEEITYAMIKSIFENCDVAVDWIDVISHRLPVSNEVNEEAWEYLHKKAIEVFDGDIDAYLEIIRTVNPYDDLLDYAENFEFGTDDSSMMEIEFSIIDINMDNVAESVFEDYYSAIIIRVARDTFALLPIEKTIIHVMHKGKEIINASFEREKIHELDVIGLDASDLMKQVAVLY